MIALPTVADKAAIRRKVDTDVRKYLAMGGKIEVVRTRSNAEIIQLCKHGISHKLELS